MVICSAKIHWSMKLFYKTNFFNDFYHSLNSKSEVLCIQIKILF